MDSRIRKLTFLCLGAAAWLVSDLAGQVKAADPAEAAVVRANDGDYCYECGECHSGSCRKGCGLCSALAQHREYCKEKLRRSHYRYVPLDPGYRDARDASGWYSAQGYNVPVASPLAPVVMYSYNYSWGMPASRLTRIGPPLRR
jgi:hypothetical protein